MYFLGAFKDLKDLWGVTGEFLENLVSFGSIDKCDLLERSMNVLQCVQAG